MSFVSALTSAILPVVAIAGVGFVLGRTRDVSVRALSTINLYVLVPALVFSSLATSSLGGSAMLTLTTGVVVFTVAMIGIGEGAARLTGTDGLLRSGLVLTTAFPNAGNYGIPLAAFAFGTVGRSTAVLFTAVQAVLLYSIGVYVVTREASGDVVGAVSEVFGLPLVYAVLIALGARVLGVVPPAESTVMQTISMTGNAAIPMMLLMLGIQLANTNYGQTTSRVWTPTVLKMVVAPLVALAIALPLGFRDPVVARVFVLESALPAAVSPLMLTIEYGTETGMDAAEFVSTTILTTTLLSVPLAAVVVTVLQSGVLL